MAIERAHIGRCPNPIATFPAAHPAVGDVSVWDDGEEVMVAVGEITHGHFDSCDESLTPGQIENQIVEDVLAFLEDLFAGRVLLWRSPDGGSGGWLISGADQSLSLMDGDDQTFTWTGPVENPLPRGSG